MQRFLRFSFLFLSILSIAGLNWYCSNTDKPAVRSSYVSLTDSAKYVGMAACKGCHNDIHSTFVHTGMGLSFDKASKQKTSASFDKHPVVYDQYKDFYYSPFWDRDSLRFKEFRLEGKDTVYQRTETVKYIVGSGQHTNSHMWESNGFLFQAPMTYYTQKGKWDLPPGFEDGNNSRFNRMIGLECMSCHNGYPEFALGSENKFTLVKNGIDCERCHGPGSIHVKEKSTGVLVDTSIYIDYSIVNPAKLPIDLQFDVCQRCHVQGNAVLNDGKSFFDFKPGMKLSDVMNVFMPVYKGREEEHIMASHAERLKQSRCYIGTLDHLQKSNTQVKNELKPYKDALTCVTCHNPHISVKQTDKSVFNTSCNNCHQQGKENLCTEDPHKLELAKNNCVSCHMQFNGSTDIPHVSVHDHKISIPVKQKEIEAIKTFVGINCLNNSSPPLEAKAQAYINYFEKFGLGDAMLDSALKYISRNNETEIRKNIGRIVNVYYLKNDFATVVRYVQPLKKLNEQLNKMQIDNAPAWTCYRIAESYHQTGNDLAALGWFKQAYELVPLSAEFANKYASSLVTTGNIQQAKSVYKKLTVDHPEFYTCNFRILGYIFVKHRRKSGYCNVSLQ